MSESERMKILRLLEEGKITAEEAARLLEALSVGESRRRHRGIGIDLSDIFEIPDIVFKSMRFAHPFFQTDEESRNEFRLKKQVSLKGVSGDIEVVGSDNGKIIVERRGLGYVSESDDELKIKMISGNFKITLPRSTEVNISGVSGNIILTDMENRVTLHTVSGNIIGKRLKGEIFGKVASGDVQIELLSIKTLEIKGTSGDLRLFIGPQVEAHIELYSHHGLVECDLPLDVKEQRDNYLSGVYQSEKGKIYIESHDGDIYLKKIQA